MKKLLILILFIVIFSCEPVTPDPEKFYWYCETTSGGIPVIKKDIFVTESEMSKYIQSIQDSINALLKCPAKTICVKK